MKEDEVKIGPVQLLAIGFNPEAKFEGKILEELSKLEKERTIRVLDLLFVKKDSDSDDLVALSFQAEDMGSIVSKLLGLDPEKKSKKNKTAVKKSGGNAFGLSESDIENLGQSLEPGTAAGVILIEHVWAKSLKKSVRDTHGVVLAEGFLTPEAIVQIAAEIKELEENLMSASQEANNGKRAYN